MAINNDKAVDISECEFEETVNNGKTVVVDFYAEWCMPCLMIAPVIEELADKIKDVKFVKLNVDDNQELARKYGVSSIPCLIIFKDGKEVDRMIGNQTGEAIEERLASYL